MEDDEDDDEMGGTPRAVQQISWHLLTTEENLRKPSGEHSSETSHCFKWGPFPPNEVCRIMLPAPLAKPIRVWPEERAELRSRV